MFFGLGKKRSKFGKFVDREELLQIDIEEESKLSRGTISKLCNDPHHIPKHSTAIRVIKALNRMGKNVEIRDFWKDI
jgi:hypothetical protein